MLTCLGVATLLLTPSSIAGSLKYVYDIVEPRKKN